MSEITVPSSPATNRLADRLRQFFYAEEVPYGLALTRMMLPATLLIAFVPRWFRARELFSTDGAAAPLWNSYGYDGLLPEPNAPLAVALCTALIFFLVTTSIGWRTRLSTIASCVLLTYLSSLDMIGTMTKYSVLSTHLFFLLALSSCGDVWSVDAWLARRRRCLFDPAAGIRRSAVWPRRLIQILIGTTYFAATMTKLQTPAYFNGDQMLFWMLTDLNAANPVGELASLYPPMIVCMGFVTLVWEVLFLFLCWKGTGRVAMLGIGVLFHFMTWLLLGLIVFPLVCLSAYWAFYSEQDIRSLARFVRRKVRQLAPGRRLRSLLATRPALKPQGSFARHAGWAFAASLALLLITAIEVEPRLDLYGMNRPEGPHQLQPMNPDRAVRMLSTTEAIRPTDKLLSFDVGTILLGGLLADRRREFRAGEQAVLECGVIPPHEDLWVEVNLHDAENRLVLRNGQVIPRERTRLHFLYELKDSLPSGKYDFVLRLDGQEVARRRIALVRPGDSSSQPVAMAPSRLVP